MLFPACQTYKDETKQDRNPLSYSWLMKHGSMFRPTGLHQAVQLQCHWSDDDDDDIMIHYRVDVVSFSRGINKKWDEALVFFPTL